jgi:signal peptidase
MVVPRSAGTEPVTRAPGIAKASVVSVAPSVCKWLWLVILLWLAAVYLLVNVGLPRILDASANMYLGQPLAWLALADLAYLGWRFGLKERPAPNRHLTAMGLLAGLLHVALLVFAGMAYGFGHSPYAHQLLPLLGNLLYVGSMLLGVEIARAYLAVLFGQGSPLVSVAAVSLLFAFVGIPAGRYAAVEGAASLFRFSGETLLPAIAQNVLASFLALSGGPVAALGYRAALQAFEWLSPILPNLPWAAIAFVSTMGPVLGLLLMQGQLQPRIAAEERVQSRSSSAGGLWVFAALLAVTLVWFNGGFFGVQPTVVSGVSMLPALKPGDIAIVRPVEPESIQVGDIVRFRHEGLPILHRVVEIHETDRGLEFVTQGDANNVQDAAFAQSQLEGKVVLVIPKVGLAGVGVRRVIEWIRGGLG